MAFFDMPLAQLEVYQPKRPEPDDFDAFWERTLAETRAYDLSPQFDLVDYGLAAVETYDVTFSGFGGQAIKAWLLLPKSRNGAVPCIVEYIGYGGGRGTPLDWLTWSAMGYAHFIMDTRGQGSRWLNGDTPDNAAEGQTPQHPGFMTRGILSPESYYYRRLMTDAVRAVETAQAHDAINSEQIVVTGGSQGGGLTIAVAGLVSDIFAAMPDVPFMCHFGRAIRLIGTAPYNEISHYLSIHRNHIDRAMNTLSYFDGMNFAARATTPTLFSVGLMDDICPPSTVYAAYNHYAGEKSMAIYEFNNHEGGQTFQTIRQAEFLGNLFGANSA